MYFSMSVTFTAWDNCDIKRTNSKTMMRPRTIIYRSPEMCSVCSKSDRLIKTDSPEPVDPMHVVYGPGDDDYGRNIYPPEPIKSPDPVLTKVICEGCGLVLSNEVIEGLEVLSDSAQEEYDKHKEKLRKWLDTDSTDSE